MRQGWRPLSLAVALAVVALAAAPLAAPGSAEAARKAPDAASEAKSKRTERQFTGVVTALDRNTLTVEKRGRKPQSRVFTRHAELKTTGDLARNARVTVYYRDEGGQAVAHRVVVKTAAGGAATDR